MRPLLPDMREHVEREIERLIALLDELDGDCDLEDGADDEPSIGSNPLISVMGEMEVDLEFDEEREQDEGDYDFPGMIQGGQGL